MTADPLRDLFGPAPNSDPLADVFGTAPNEDFARGNPLEHQDSGLGRALRGGAEPATTSTKPRSSRTRRGRRRRAHETPAPAKVPASTSAISPARRRPARQFGEHGRSGPGRGIGSNSGSVRQSVGNGPGVDRRLFPALARARQAGPGSPWVSVASHPRLHHGRRRPARRSRTSPTRSTSHRRSRIRSATSSRTRPGLRGLADTMLVGGYEAGEEVAQQIVQNFATKLGLDPNTPVRDWPKGLARAGAERGRRLRRGLHRSRHRGPVGRARPVARPPLGMREARRAQPRHHARGRGEPASHRPHRPGQDDDGRGGRHDQGQPGASRVGDPDVGTRVTVSHNGKQQHGAIADAWTVNVAGQDSVGVKIKLDDGTMIEEPVDTLRDMGVTITPVAAAVRPARAGSRESRRAAVRRRGHGDGRGRESRRRRLSNFRTPIPAKNA
jgi:hypothetical protein